MYEQFGFHMNNVLCKSPSDTDKDRFSTWDSYEHRQKVSYATTEWMGMNNFGFICNILTYETTYLEYEALKISYKRSSVWWLEFGWRLPLESLFKLHYNHFDNHYQLDILISTSSLDTLCQKQGLNFPNFFAKNQFLSISSGKKILSGSSRAISTAFSR